MKILVVDDDRTSRAFFRRELSGGGYDIIEASDGFEAIHVIHDQDIDLVLLDIEMPDMDGYQVCTWLRSEQFSQRFSQRNTGLLPIVFVTSSESLESRLKGFRAGATDFITKGFKPGSLLKLVNRLLKPANPLEGLTALLVDDARLVRNMVNGMLREQGMEVIEATDGQEGYELLLENLERVDMVLTDLEMPHMKGDELCFKIRKDLGLKDMPVIFLTAVPDREVLIDLFKAGANDYLIKPFVKEELIARLRVIQELFQNLDEERDARKRIQAELARSRAKSTEQVEVTSRIELTNTVLHNVNNVLNSVSVSCGQLISFLGDSRLSQLLLALDLMAKNHDDLTRFLTEDEKGKKLPEYFRLIRPILQDEHQQMYEEVNELHKKIRLMKDVVDAQQRGTSPSAGPAICDLARLVANAVSINEKPIETHEIEVETFIDDELHIEADEVALTHVLINLVKNAIEAMKGSPKRVLTLACRDTDPVILEVRDTGSGIAPEDLDKVFQHGFSTKQDGHGFGLAFCHRVLRENRGGLRVHSNGPGTGATFTLSLPKAARTAERPIE